MKKNSLGIFTILGMLLMVVFVSGCTSTSQNLNQTFSSQGISFNYPSDWTTGNFSAEDLPNNVTGLVRLGLLQSPDGMGMGISKVNLTAFSGNTTVAALKDLSKSSIINESAQVLSDNQTNINGVNVYAIVYTKNNTSTNKSEKTMQVVTGVDGQTAYLMQFTADPQTFDQDLQLINQIIATVKIQ